MQVMAHPMRRGRPDRLRHASGGFTYVWALAAVALVSVGLSVLGPLWSDRNRHDREQELLRIGRLYADAIASYRAVSPGSVKQYPERLEELLEDSRFWGTRRHLRKLYPDPMKPSRPWGLVLDQDGRIRGVYSQGEERPFLQAPRDLGLVRLAIADHYADWKFVPQVPPSVGSAP